MHQAVMNVNAVLLEIITLPVGLAAPPLVIRLLSVRVSLSHFRTETAW
jgi:hypothetical protein